MLILAVPLFAQKSELQNRQIYIAKTYTEHGEPIGSVHFKNVEKEKTYSIILSSGRKEFKEHLVFLNIDRTSNKNPDNIFSKLIRTEKGKTFVAFNYTFSYEGEYNIFFTDFTKRKIASAVITVKAETKKKPDIAIPIETRTSLEIIFSKKIIGNYPVDLVKSISMYNDGGEVYIFIADNKPLNTSKITLGIWKKKDGAGFDQFMESKKFQIEKDWRDTFFKYRFAGEGEYKINIFDENEILLKTAYINVQK